MFTNLSLRASLLILGTGGQPSPESPNRTDLDSELRRLAADPTPPARPLVILNGYHTPANVALWAAQRLAPLTGRSQADIVTVSYPTRGSITQAARDAARIVNMRWPSTDPLTTAEVDVIGISMGGLVARVAHAHTGNEPRLNIARLFTFGTPHQGSFRAAMVAPDQAARDMKPGSPFLQSLNANPIPFELTCYVQHRDFLVAPQHAAPPGHTPLTAPGSRLMSHFTTIHNPWFLADTARRLKGLPPLLNRTTLP